MPPRPRKTTAAKPAAKTPTDAAVAEATEAAGIVVPYGGFDYKIDPEATETFAFRDAMQRGGDTDIVAAMLGGLQYRILLERHARENGEKVIKDFMDAYAAARGSGNS